MNIHECYHLAMAIANIQKSETQSFIPVQTIVESLNNKWWFDFKNWKHLKNKLNKNDEEKMFLFFFFFFFVEANNSPFKSLALVSHWITHIKQTFSECLDYKNSLE